MNFEIHFSYDLSLFSFSGVKFGSLCKMETKTPARFTLGRQSSLAPERHSEESEHEKDDAEDIDPGVKLMYLANEGDVEGIRELLDSGINVNFKDIDGRTALHVAACQGLTQVVALLLQKGAQVDPKDRWGSTVSTMFPLSFSSHPLLFIYGFLDEFGMLVGCYENSC